MNNTNGQISGCGVIIEHGQKNAIRQMSVIGLKREQACPLKVIFDDYQYFN